MAKSLRIAIDVMGGDHGLRSSLPAALNSLKQFPQLQLVLIGAADRIRRELGAIPAQIHIVDAEQVVDASDRPAQALRHKTQSSMRIAIEMLAAREVDAVVSAGNTGALMAMGLFVLKTLPNIDRPAICAPMPTRNGSCLLLDLGANVDCTAGNLHQFALMGSALAAVDGIARPRVALLNIGAEDSKGNEQVKLAAAVIEQDARLNYCGFVEGDTIFHDSADVVVCDGFAGNIALKVCEGTASFIADKIHAKFSRNLATRMCGLIAKPIMRSLYRELDPQHYNGACFLGLQGVVVKSHGNSNVAGFQRAIARAASAVEQDLLGLIAQRLAQ